jgi:uncharacterized membrane protein
MVWACIFVALTLAVLALFRAIGSLRFRMADRVTGSDPTALDEIRRLNHYTDISLLVGVILLVLLLALSALVETLS